MYNPQSRVVNVIQWIEAFEESNLPVVLTMRLHHILKYQIDKNPLYGSFPERAIEDFIDVYWAWVTKINLNNINKFC